MTVSASMTRTRVLAAALGACWLIWGAAVVQAQSPAPEMPEPELSEPVANAASALAAPAADVDMWDTGISATGAVLMTPLFPGWGQLYSDGGWRAALAFGAEMYFWTNLLSRDRQARRDVQFAGTLDPEDPNRAYYGALSAEHWAQMRDFVWWSGGALLIIALDAYVGAHLFNFAEDPVPVPDRWDDVFGPLGSGPLQERGGVEVVVFQWRKGF